MSSACRFIFMQIKVIFIRMVSHLDLLWNRGTRELENGLLPATVQETSLGGGWSRESSGPRIQPKNGDKKALSKSSIRDLFSDYNVMQWKNNAKINQRMSQEIMMMEINKDDTSSFRSVRFLKLQILYSLKYFAQIYKAQHEATMLVYHTLTWRQQNSANI